MLFPRNINVVKEVPVVVKVIEVTFLTIYNFGVLLSNK